MSTFNYLVRELFELFQYSSHIAISVLQLFIAETNLLIPIRYISFEILVRNRCRHIILLKRKSNNTHNIVCVSFSLSKAHPRLSVRSDRPPSRMGRQMSTNPWRMIMICDASSRESAKQTRGAWYFTLVRSSSCMHEAQH